MSVAATTNNPPARVEQPAVQESGSCVDVVLRAGFNAAASAWAASAFAIMAPGPAAAFGAISSVNRQILRACLNTEKDPGVMKTITVYSAAAAGAALVMKLASVPMTLNATLSLTASMIVAANVAGLVALTCLCGCGCCAAIVASMNRS